MDQGRSIKEIKKYIELNKNYVRICGTQLKQHEEGNLQKFYTYVRKQEKTQISNLSSKLKKVEKDEKRKSKGSKRNPSQKKEDNNKDRN